MLAVTVVERYAPAESFPADYARRDRSLPQFLEINASASASLYGGLTGAAQSVAMTHAALERGHENASETDPNNSARIAGADRGARPHSCGPPRQSETEEAALPQEYATRAAEPGTGVKIVANPSPLCRTRC